MSNASSKAIGIIVVVIALIALFFLGSTSMRWFGWPFREHGLFFPLSMLSILWLLLAVWVYKDAEGRGMNGLLWALLVFVGNLIGLIIYLIVRSERKAAETLGPAAVKTVCPSCGADVSAGFKFCPNCGKSVQPTCPSCGKPAESSWKACPYCGRTFEDGPKI
ncbi:MAG: zinc ribbon domain-containing protein [Candidatus Aminicenantes bacterium]|nr:zinc ribbon domain-containing protein [Candidatus Aminicenantes bacterium]